MRTGIQRKAAYACARLFCAALALFALLFGAKALAETDGMLRVRLARLGTPSAITMRADCDYWLYEDSSVRIPSGTDMTVAAHGGSLTLTAQGHTAQLGASARLIRDGSGTRGLVFSAPALSNRFCGDLYLSASGDAISAVLRIYIEDYLYGVVGYEMSPSSAFEALKAQAIVARNYALRQKSARAGSAYDLSDTGDALSFRGYNDASEYADAVRAVDETRGQVLCYGDSPAACYFCDSNGGQTESSENAFGVALPYSVVMDDTYDFNGGGAKKTATLRPDATQLEPALEAALVDGMADQLRLQNLSADPDDIHITAIEDIVPESPLYPEPSRLYSSLAFTLSVSSRTPQGEAGDARVTVHIPTYGALEQWYDLSINDADNETVWVTHDSRAFEITFRRSGSGVGMSQRGAHAMGKKGLSYETILDYYYPGTALRKMDLSDAGQEAAPAPTETPEAVQPIATARLSQKCRLYESADTSAAALTTLPAGATVSVYAVRGDWAAIGSGELYGFIHAEALSSFALVGVTAAQVLDETFARVNAGPVSVLQLPVATAAVLDTLAAGSLVRLNAYTDEWALVTTSGDISGFIPRDALTLQSSDGSEQSGQIVASQDNLYGLITQDCGLYVNADDSISPRESLSKGTYVQILAYSSSWASVRTAEGLTGFVKLDCLSAVQQVPAQAEEDIDGGKITTVEGTRYLYVDADALSLFKSYSTDSAILATLRRGDRVRVGAYNEKWACVEADGKVGFALLSGLTETAPAEAEPSPEGGEITKVRGELYATVVADGAPLYPSYSDSDAPIARLEAGTRVRIGAYNRVWACVNAEGTLGFMRIEALELSANEPAEDTEIHYLECDAVTTADVVMYSDASLTGSAVLAISKGEKVHIYAYNRQCAYADYNGQRGFVALRYLKKQ